MNLNLKKTFGIGLSIFTLLFASVGLTACDEAGEVEQEGVEIEKEEGEKPEIEEE